MCFLWKHSKISCRNCLSYMSVTLAYLYYEICLSLQFRATLPAREYKTRTSLSWFSSFLKIGEALVNFNSTGNIPFYDLSWSLSLLDRYDIYLIINIFIQISFILVAFLDYNFKIYFLACSSINFLFLLRIGKTENIFAVEVS